MSAGAPRHRPVFPVLATRTQPVPAGHATPTGTSTTWRQAMARPANSRDLRVDKLVRDHSANLPEPPRDNWGRSSLCPDWGVSARESYRHRSEADSSTVVAPGVHVADLPEYARGGRPSRPVSSPVPRWVAFAGSRSCPPIAHESRSSRSKDRPRARHVPFRAAPSSSRHRPGCAVRGRLGAERPPAAASPLPRVMASAWTTHRRFPGTSRVDHATGSRGVDSPL